MNYKEECIRILNEHKKEMEPVKNYEYSELGCDFLGFLEEYSCLNIPNNFTVIDLGCYQAVQALYFKNSALYIGVDNGCPCDSRLLQENTMYFKDSIQHFIQIELPKLCKKGLNLNKTFAICSYVPDKEAQKMVRETFPYHKVVYCSEIISEKLVI